MSAAKFASITGSLLARKGEAGPSADRQALEERWRPHDVTMPEVRHAPVVVPAQSVAAEPSLKVAMRLSEAQHFRLRVAAAQLQVSRQALMSAALDHYLSTVCAAGVPSCRCLRASGPANAKGCGCTG
ncbi:MAG: hypothetical protein Q7S99_14330 [Parvibaculum sp.]|nr:hypothetical protein [Parvibaculum sp.]|tara:strand:+ start:1255 stop:1638 length:384 start_codon:yes stop_codon:yes gene_type:complete